MKNFDRFVVCGPDPDRNKHKAERLAKKLTQTTKPKAMTKVEVLKWWNDIGSKLRVHYTSKYFPNPKYMVERNVKRINQIYLKEGYDKS